MVVGAVVVVLSREMNGVVGKDEMAIEQQVPQHPTGP